MIYLVTVEYMEGLQGLHDNLEMVISANLEEDAKDIALKEIKALAIEANYNYGIGYVYSFYNGGLSIVNITNNDGLLLYKD